MIDFYNTLEKIKDIDPKSHVFITTYQFDPDFFEKQIFSHFKQQSFPLICVDSGEYEGKIKAFMEVKSAGRGYFVEKISCPHIFHPKLFLSISDKEIFLLIGSNNLTRQGYTTNAEIVTPVWIDLESLEHGYLLDDLKVFLQKLYDSIASVQFKEDLLSIIKLIPHQENQQRREAWILNNISEISLFQQILDIINEPVTKIHVISPFLFSPVSF